MKTKTFKRRKPMNPESISTVTQRYHATRQDGVKAKIADYIEQFEAEARMATEMAEGFKKLKAEDFKSVKDFMKRGYAKVLMGAGV